MHYNKSITQLQRGYPPPLEHRKPAQTGFLAILATQIARLVIDGEELSFSPVLPLGWQGYTLRLTFRGSKFDVQITGSTGKLTLTEGSAIPVIVYGLEYMLEDEFEFDLVKNEAFPDE